MVNYIKPFYYWVQNVLPQVYDDSLSYYELFNKVVIYLNNVIDATNSTAAEVNRLSNQLAQLQVFINQYFDSPEFEQKLEDTINEMISEGDFSELVEEALAQLVEDTEDRIAALEDAEILTVATVSPENKNVPTRKLSKELNKPSFYNVLDYGAVADGVTDNFTALNDLLQLVYESGGGVVYFPRGQYNIHNNLCVGDNTTLRGDGYDSYIYMTTSGNHSGEVICCYGSHILIEDLRIDFLDSEFTFDLGGNNMGIVGITNGSLATVGNKETPQASAVDVEDITVRRIYTNATYVTQTETGQSAYIKGITYEDIMCEGVISIVAHKAYEICDIFIKNCTCQGIRLSNANSAPADSYLCKNVHIIGCKANWVVCTLSNTFINGLDVEFVPGTAGYDNNPFTASSSAIVRLIHGTIVDGLKVTGDNDGGNVPVYMALIGAGGARISNAVFEFYDNETVFTDVIHALTSAHETVFDNVQVPRGSSNTVYGKGNANFPLEDNNTGMTQDVTITLNSPWEALSPSHYPNSAKKYGNIVKLNIGIYKSTAGYTNNNVIATLSADAKPSADRRIIATGFNRSDYSVFHLVVCKVLAETGNIALDTAFDHSSANVDAIFIDSEYMI